MNVDFTCKEVIYCTSLWWRVDGSTPFRWSCMGLESWVLRKYIIKQDFGFDFGFLWLMKVKKFGDNLYSCYFESFPSLPRKIVHLLDTCSLLDVYSSVKTCNFTDFLDEFRIEHH